MLLSTFIARIRQFERHVKSAADFDYLRLWMRLERNLQLYIGSGSSSNSAFHIYVELLGAVWKAISVSVVGSQDQSVDVVGVRYACSNRSHYSVSERNYV